MKASVIIPTKNAGPIFRDVLAAARAQETEWPFEVIVVDSGSTDGTVELVKQHPDVTLIEIPPAEFGHGRTRNLAVAKARGEFCAFLTHDSLPADMRWLFHLVAAVEQDRKIAGAFGPHLAYPEHNAFTKRDLTLHFETFKRLPLVLSRDTDPQRYEKDQGWRQILHFYSDNNSCLRRSAWQETPYPDVEFAEDQIWASKVIEAGWKKAFAPDAAVVHSHEYRPIEQLQRAFDESLAFRILFGYRLGDKPLPAIRSAVNLALADWRWGRAHDVKFAHVLRRMCNDVALVAGHSLGSRGDWLPDGIRIRLSRDKKLFYSAPS